MTVEKVNVAECNKQ